MHSVFTYLQCRNQNFSMREFRSNNEIVENITNEIWNVYNTLRGGLNTNDFDVVLLFLSGYKDGLIDQTVHNYYHGIKNVVLEKLAGSNQYVNIITVYKPIINSLPEKLIDFLVNELLRFNGEKLKEYFPEIFDDLLYKLSNAQGKLSGEFIQPLEITQFIMNLAHLPDDAKVYNPFAGVASFGTFLNHNQHYYGQEFNERTWALGTLRLMAHGQNAFNYILDDSIEHWNSFEKFDLVVASPPFNLPIPKYIHSHYSGDQYGTVDNFIIDNGINSINENGQLIAMLPLSFLFNGGSKGRLKERFVENNLIDKIITLPTGLLHNTYIAVCIVVLKKHTKRPGYIQFVDATTFFTKDGPRNKILNASELSNLINNESENDFVRYVSKSEIYKNEFDLSVKRYFLQDIEGSPLSSFTDIIGGQKAPQNVKMKQVQIKNLKDDVFDSVLTSDELDSKIVERTTFRIIQESCILLTTRWNALKPTYFQFTGEPIAVSEAITAIRLDENKVEPRFLINEFSADYVKKQLDSYRIGSIMQILRLKDLKNILIKLPAINEQRAKVSGIVELSSRLKEIKSDKEDLLSGIKKEETESSTSLSHVLGKPLLSIGSSLEIIISTLSKEFPNWRDIMISESRQFKMSDAFDSISKNVKYIQELADENTALVSVSSFNLTEINFLKFLSEFVKHEKKSLKNNIVLKLDIHEDIKEQMNNKVVILGNEQKLKIVLINLIDNAKNHAFIDKDMENSINIELLPFTGNEIEATSLNYDINSRKSYVEVRVSNTGKSFPKDFTLEDYIRKNFAVGKTRNRGLGGYEVNEIVKAHNEGKRALNLFSFEEGQKYSSTVSFIIPII